MILFLIFIIWILNWFNNHKCKVGDISIVPLKATSTHPVQVNPILVRFICGKIELWPISLNALLLFSQFVLS